MCISRERTSAEGTTDAKTGRCVLGMFKKWKEIVNKGERAGNEVGR